MTHPKDYIRGTTISMAGFILLTVCERIYTDDRTLI